MPEAEFNRLIDRCTAGLPVSLVITRLLLLLSSLVDDSVDAAALLRTYVDESGQGGSEA
jgi:hypothetical protein